MTLANLVLLGFLFSYGEGKIYLGIFQLPFTYWLGWTWLAQSSTREWEKWRTGKKSVKILSV